MAISNRTVTIKNVFASTAETNIPNPPVPGQSYRNTNLTSEEVGQGWPFKEIVDSAKFNEAMYEYTTICQQLEKYGFLPWSANTDYPAGGCALGPDGNVYQAKKPTGPSTTAVDPVTDTSHTYWDLFYYATVAANRALVSNGNGKVSASATTATEIGYVHGVTSALQTQLNNKANNNSVVHLTGRETIAGVKTFTSDPWLYNSNPVLYHRQPNFNKGDIPQANITSNNTFVDDTGNLQSSNLLASYGSTIFTNGSTRAHITAYRNVAGSTDNASIFVSYPIDGDPYTYAPTPTDTTSTSSNQIVTVGWANSANNNIVHKTGDETIGGTKTFSSDPYIKNIYPQLYMDDDDQTKGTAPSADKLNGINFRDTNGNLMGRCRQLYTPSKINRVELLVYKANSSSDTEYATMGVRYPASGDPYTYAPASDVINSIVTTTAIHKATSKGSFKLGNGMIVNYGSQEMTKDSTTVCTFDTPFSGNYTYGLSTSYKSGVTRDDPLTIQDRTSTNFTVRNTARDSGSVRCIWVAIGY